MNWLLDSIRAVQPIPEEWELVFALGAVFSLIGAVLLYLTQRRRVQKYRLAIAITFGLALVALTGISYRYLHTFEPAPGDAAERTVLPEPLLGCGRLAEYRAALTEHEAMSPEEWRNRVYHPDCRSGAITTVAVTALLFFITLTTLLLVVLHTVDLARQRRPGLFKVIFDRFNR